MGPYTVQVRGVKELVLRGDLDSCVQAMERVVRILQGCSCMCASSVSVAQWKLERAHGKMGYWVSTTEQQKIPSAPCR